MQTNLIDMIQELETVKSTMSSKEKLEDRISRTESKIERAETVEIMEMEINNLSNLMYKYNRKYK